MKPPQNRNLPRQHPRRFQKYLPPRTIFEHRFREKWQ
jgi:hypothetical protein